VLRILLAIILIAFIDGFASQLVNDATSILILPIIFLAMGIIVSILITR